MPFYVLQLDRAGVRGLRTSRHRFGGGLCMARQERLDTENRKMVDHDLHFGYARYVTDVGMRELRQNPAPVLREVEGGAEVTVLVNGRAVARIVPLEAPAWVAGERAERIYGTTVDPGWEDELRATRTEDFVDDPWE